MISSKISDRIVSGIYSGYLQGFLPGFVRRFLARFLQGFLQGFDPGFLLFRIFFPNVSEFCPDFFIGCFPKVPLKLFSNVLPQEIFFGVPSMKYLFKCFM